MSENESVRHVPPSPGRLRKRWQGRCIGITIGLHGNGESLWINGIKQNALYLAKLFRASLREHHVMLVNTTEVALGMPLPWDRNEFPTVPFDEAKDHLDVLIELGGQIDAQRTRDLRARGVRIISYCCGPEYVQNAEAILFGRGSQQGIFINDAYDEVWVIPQVAESSWHFFKTLRRCPVRQVPFVWDPMCLEARSHGLPHEAQYRPHEGPKRMTILEPNLDVVKFCLYPMLIAEGVYRKLGAETGPLLVGNALYLARENPRFASIAGVLDVVRDGKTTFAGRFDTPEVLARYTDIVISHQWSLALNYFYLEVCWLGYPLVHNAHLCRDLGYFYGGNDVDAGTREVIRAIRRHDADWEGYLIRQRRAIRRFMATQPRLISVYDEMLDRVCLPRRTQDVRAAYEA